MNYVFCCICVCIGKLADDLHPGVPANYIEFPNEAKVRDLSAANFYMLALTTSGDVYYWGKSQVRVHRGYISPI